MGTKAGSYTSRRLVGFIVFFGISIHSWDPKEEQRHFVNTAEFGSSSVFFYTDEFIFHEMYVVSLYGNKYKQTKNSKDEQRAKCHLCRDRCGQ